MSEKMDSPRRRRGSLVGPIILIAVGLFFLLSNLGLIAWNFWEAAARLWPLVLVAIGLDLLIGRRSWLGSALVLLATIILLVAGLVWLGGVGRGLVTHEVSQPLNGADRAEAHIAFGVGNLQLQALPASSSLLVEGTLEYDNGRERVEESFTVEDGLANYAISAHSQPGGLAFFGRSAPRTWELSLNRDTPVQLDIRTGVGQATLDLYQLNVTHLNIESGVGQTTVILPARGELTGTIQGGVGELVIEIPEGVAARINVETGLGSSQILGDYRQDGSVYTSPGYETAEVRIDLELKAGIGQVTVRNYDGR